MPALFLELFGEEIPARMQARAADDLARLLSEALASLQPAEVRTYVGARRIAYAATLADGVPASRTEERGPRTTAPEQALAGFLRKHAAAREDLRDQNGFWVLSREQPGAGAAEIVARALPPLLWRFPWPKSMRWGGSSAFTWVRPLRRVACVLDGTVVPFALAQGDDDAHGLASSDQSEGHRFLSPGPFAVTSEADWLATLRARHVLADPVERRAEVERGLGEAAAARGLSFVPDAGLIDEISGLVEWPVPLIGRIGAEFMDLPAEVMQVSMRVNQRFVALRDAAGAAAPFFAFAANVAARDGGAAIVAGNERVLRARFSDARHFWDLDRTIPLADRVDALKGVIFHARLGTQYDRARRIERIASAIAPLVGASPTQGARAGLLAKADLTTGMVAEFPELQGVMGGYYARANEDAAVAEAIAEHYQPRGPTDPVPTAFVSIAVALADKLDQLIQFFGIGESPSGSGDPFALRRAGLGLLRILRENELNVPLDALLDAAGADSTKAELQAFLIERTRVQLRTDGMRHDIVSAALASGDDRVLELARRAEALAAMVTTEDGANLLAGYKRATNILRIEDAKDGPHIGDVPADDPLIDNAERDLRNAVADARMAIKTPLGAGLYSEVYARLAQLRPTVDRFFDRVTVNDSHPPTRRARLSLLAAFRDTMNLAADFSRIES